MPPHEMDLDAEICAVGRHSNISGIESLVSPGDGPMMPIASPLVTAATAASSGTAGLHSEIGLLMCRCTMIHEDSLEAYDNDADDADVTTIDQSLSDSELVPDESSVGEAGMEPSFGNTLEVPTSVHSMPVGSRPLVNVRSLPQLLNEICEEAETADDEDAPNSAAVVQTHSLRRSSTEQSRHLDRLHRVHRRKMATMVPRVASCSSSDASDTDEIVDQNGQKRRKQKPSTAAPANVKYLGRRDSSEHSSDTDSQPCGNTNYQGTSSVSAGICGSTVRRSSDSQCGNQQGQGHHSGRTKRAESEHSYQRHALTLCRTAGRCNSAVITNWKPLDSRLVLQLFSDCYSEEPEDKFCDYWARLDKDWIMNARNQLSSLIQLHSEDSCCVTNSADPSLIDGLMKWCTDGCLQTGGYNMTNRVNSNSVTVLTGVGCRDSFNSRLRARKVSL